MVKCTMLDSLLEQIKGDAIVNTVLLVKLPLSIEATIDHQELQKL
jgi:hypothetical protein